MKTKLIPFQLLNYQGDFRPVKALKYYYLYFYLIKTTTTTTKANKHDQNLLSIFYSSFKSSNLAQNLHILLGQADRWNTWLLLSSTGSWLVGSSLTQGQAGWEVTKAGRPHLCSDKLNCVPSRADP